MANNINSEKVPWRFVLPLVLGTMMNPLNSTMLATALVTLCNSFKITVGSGAILITSLYVTSTIAQPLMGRLADIYSAKSINTLGFFLAMAAAIMGIFAPNIGWLIVSRILLGLGTSAAYPSAMALINKKYEAEGKTVPGNILGIMAISGQVSSVLGPTLGGLLTQAFGWRGIFFINIPWVIVGLILSRAVPAYPPEQSDFKEGIFKRIDGVGIILVSAFLLALLNALIGHNSYPVSISIAVVMLMLVIVWERTQASPFIDVKLLAHKPSLSMVYVRTFATYYILYLLLYGLPQWLQGVKHIMPASAGLILLPMTLTAITVGYLASKNNKPVLQNVVGVLVMLTACAAILLLHADTPVYGIIGITIIVGMADGINMIANQALLNGEAPPEQKGVSFGLFRTAGYIGAIISSTQLKHLFEGGVTDSSFHKIGFFALASGAILLILLVPLLTKKSSRPIIAAT